ncbi:MAG: hypothetical protein D6761_07135 [Candidatus Dadabacteria bacterium]|nr:MAG: hypothetical protein D6761_07135 [Candidatus Dadabacteria bacterium]
MIPESDEARVRGFLQRIFGEEIAQLPYAELFPREVPGAFTFQRATEWMEALGRAGVRTRVEVETTPESEYGELTAGGATEAVVEAPLDIWWNLLRRPEAAFRRLQMAPPAQLLVLGVLFVMIGEILAWPGELIVMRRLSAGLLEAESAGRLLLTWIVLTPVARLLSQAVLLWFVLRLLGVGGRFIELLVLAGLANAASPLKVVPVVGSFAAAMCWVWLAATGASVWYDLSRARTSALAAAPFILALLPLVLIGALIVAAIVTAGPVALEGLETVPWLK